MRECNTGSRRSGKRKLREHKKTLREMERKGKNERERIRVAGW